MTTLCGFCSERLADNSCRLGLNAPRAMSCRDFAPAIEEFCSTATDFTGSAQVVQMATFFGLRGTEMKKVREMAAREEARRTAVASDASSHPGIHAIRSRP